MPSGECNGDTDIDGKYVGIVIELNRINGAAFLKIHINICLCNLQNGKWVVVCVLAIGND